MRRALAVGEESIGPNHPHVATYLNNLAILLKATHRIDEAEPLLRRALAISEENSGWIIPMSRSVSATSPSCSKPPTESTRPSRRCAALSPSTKRALGQTTPMSRSASATSPSCSKPPTELMRLEPFAPRSRHWRKEPWAGPFQCRDPPQQPRPVAPSHNRIDEAEPLMHRAVAIRVEFTRRTGHRHPSLDWRL